MFPVNCIKSYALSAPQLESSDYRQAYQLLLLFAYGTWAEFKGVHLSHASQRLAALLPVPLSYPYAGCSVVYLGCVL
jgi:hypothetical protein